VADILALCYVVLSSVMYSKVPFCYRCFRGKAGAHIDIQTVDRGVPVAAGIALEGTMD